MGVNGQMRGLKNQNDALKERLWFRWQAKNAEAMNGIIQKR